MTAFARESMSTDMGTLTVEIRTVNHRYLDCNFKLPDSLRSLESGFREQASKALARGKLDCFVRLQSQGVTASSALNIDSARLQQVLSAAQQIAELSPESQALNPLEVLAFPGVCTSPEDSEKALQQSATALFKQALDSLRENRAREGEKLEQMILERLEQVASELAQLRQQLPQLMEQQRQRVIKRIQDLEVDIDQGRLEQELVFMAQKADVDEELDRLDAHIAEVRHSLNKGGPCGRRLDFLMQEFNREANTLSSKSTAISTTQSAVELKVLIEQMREQVQNIE
ncbi:YicC/YloC family endoribonuclease [Sediminihaliea albiluteola]|nr:YicC/YloC family endoribonuclease [Sediminihaliea albiluteola]